MKVFRKHIYGFSLSIAAFLAMAFVGCNTNLPNVEVTEKIINVPTPIQTPYVTTVSPALVPTPCPTPEPYDLIYVDSSDITKGELVLVNWQREYMHTDELETIKVIEHKSENLLQENNEARLSLTALENLNALADRFFEYTGGDRLYLTSGYRTVEYQKELYNDYAAENGTEMAAIYVANAGYSEHHTGLAVDLSTLNTDGARVTLLMHEDSEWFNRVCKEYGFILRYPVGSQEVTHIAYEPWHFRYVGTANAYAISGLNLIYEQYIERVKQYTVDDGMLYVTSYGELSVVEYDEVNLTLCMDNDSNGDEDVTGNDEDNDELVIDGWLIFYVPASESEKTEIRIPKGVTNYSISGNNEDGFIITAEIEG